MKLIEIPFKEDFKDRMLSGRKRATTRSKRYGDPGDIFEIFGGSFKLTAVYKEKLRHVAAAFYKIEGFEKPEDFKACWIELHPRRGFVPDEDVFLHLFERVIE